MPKYKHAKPSSRQSTRDDSKIESVRVMAPACDMEVQTKGGRKEGRRSKQCARYFPSSLDHAVAGFEMPRMSTTTSFKALSEVTAASDVSASICVFLLAILATDISGFRREASENVVTLKSNP